MLPEASKSIKIKLHTLSPLTIGSGEKLSPLADYWVRDGQVFYLHQDRFEQAMATMLTKQPNIISTFTKSVLNVRDIQKDTFLTDFIENQLRIDAETVSHDLIVPYHSQENALEMHKILRDGWQPYIAGSTLKGAFKTAIIYDWLIAENPFELENIARILIEEHSRNQRRIEERDDLAAERKLSRNDKQRLKQLRRDITRDVNRALDGVINGFLNYQPQEKNHRGKYQAKAPHDFHHLQLSDTGLFSKNELEVRQIRRLHLEAEKADTSLQVAYETLAAEASQSFSIKIRPNFQHRNLKWLNKTDNIKALFKRINKFSHDLVDYELNILNDQELTIAKQKNGRTIINAYREFLETRLAELNVTDNEVAYMQIGQGKTFFANSIGLAINDFSSDKPYFKNKENPFTCLLDLYELGNPANGLFPVTRTLENELFVPMGWVKLEI